MSYNPSNPLIVQSDKTVLLEVENSLYEACRDSLVPFAELEKSPEYIHTYRLSPLSLWNAAASGVTFEDVKDCLLTYSKYDVPQNVIDDIQSYMSRYGRLKLRRDDVRLLLYSDDSYLITEILHSKQIRPFIMSQVDGHTLEIPADLRGRVKQALIKIGFPVEDLAGYVDGDRFLYLARDAHAALFEECHKVFRIDAILATRRGKGLEVAVPDRSAL